MKLVEILARELKVWPEDVNKLLQSFSGRIFYIDSAAQVVELIRVDIAIDWIGTGVTRADWEAGRAKLKAPKANGDGWVRNRGRSDKPPVADDVMVQVVLRDESKNSFDEKPHPAKNWVWRHRASYSDLMWYRIHKPAEQSAPVSEPIISFEDMKPGMTVRFVRYTGGCHRHWSFVPGKMYSVGSDGYSVGPISDKGEVPNMNWGFEFALVGSVAEPAEQPQIKLESGAEISYSPGEPLVSMEPADTMLAIRDRIRELDTQRAEVETTYQRQISEIAQERESLVQRLAGEGLALVEVVGQADEDMSDWRNWKAGDVVEYVGLPSHSSEHFTLGNLYEVSEVKDRGVNPVKFTSDDSGEPNGWRGGCFKFVSRPAS